MPTFHYRARDRDGVLITGEIEAVSAEELKEGLFREGMIPLEVREAHAGKISLKAIEGFFGRVKPEELMMFTRQFYTLFKAGVSIDTIFSTMARQAKGSALRRGKSCSRSWRRESPSSESGMPQRTFSWWIISRTLTASILQTASTSRKPSSKASRAIRISSPVSTAK